MSESSSFAQPVSEAQPPIAPSDDSTQLWKSFTTARSEEEYYRCWLGLQSTSIANVHRSLLVLAQTNAQLVPVAGWPEGETDFSDLSDVVERVFDECCGLLVELGNKQHFGVAYPVLVEGELRGVVALEVAAVTKHELQTAMEKLQWGTGWLELLFRRKQVEKNADLLHRLKASVDLLAITLGKDDFQGAATAFTTELAMAAGCERVSLGLAKQNKSKLYAVSYSADVDQKMNLTRALEDAMDEAILQRCEVVYPPQNNDVFIYRAHDGLSRQQAMASIVTLPLFTNGRFYGALVCERAADQPFQDKELEFLKAVGSLAGPAVEQKFQNDRPLSTKLQEAAKSEVKNLVGAGHFGRKILLLTITSMVLFFSLATGEYRLSADVVLEGKSRRVIVTPFDGFIDTASVRAGDLVQEGDTLCLLDDRDLRLMSLAKQSELRQLQRQYQEAVARYDRAQAKIIKAQLEQIQAEIDLVEKKLARTRIKAPFTGLLVSGDLSQRLGGAVQQGEVLFEITPLAEYRVILKVDERRIGDVSSGQQGSLLLASRPEKTFPFTVTRVTPLAEAEEGRNYFRVEAALDSTRERLRPGMEGIGKISIDRRNLFSIWSRDLMEWFRLQLWRWLAW